MDTFAITGLVFGTAGLILGTLGLIFGVAAIRRLNALEARLAKQAPSQE
jgi:predicted PurR-regulated permease PerM